MHVCVCRERKGFSKTRLKKYYIKSKVNEFDHIKTKTLLLKKEKARPTSICDQKMHNQQGSYLFFNKFTYFIYLFQAALDVHCWARASSSCREWGLLFVMLRGLLIAVASLVAEHRLQVRASVVVAHRLSSCGSRDLERRLSSCGTRDQLLRGMWDLPGPGLEPVSPALAGGFLTTVPPGKPKALIS